MRPKIREHHLSDTKRLKWLLSRRLSANMRKSRTRSKVIVTDTEHICELVQVMLHVYENNLLEEENVIDDSRSVIDGS